MFFLTGAFIVLTFVTVAEQLNHKLFLTNTKNPLHGQAKKKKSVVWDNILKNKVGSAGQNFLCFQLFL